jgi:hypothetical protein
MVNVGSEFVLHLPLTIYHLITIYHYYASFDLL